MIVCEKLSGKFQFVLERPNSVMTGKRNPLFAAIFVMKECLDRIDQIVACNLLLQSTSTMLNQRLFNRTTGNFFYT